MQINPLTCEEREKYAHDWYDAQFDKLKHGIRKKMNKYSAKPLFYTNLVGGTLLGILFGLMAGQTIAQVPVRNENGRVIKYQTDHKKMLDTMLKFIAGSILVASALGGLMANNIANRNKKRATTLTQDTIERYFQKSLKDFSTDENETERVINAAIFIFYNMPEHQIRQLQELAINGLTLGRTGYLVHPDAVDEAAKIISDFVNSNSKVGYNVLRIMRGEQPAIYYLRNMKPRQK